MSLFSQLLGVVAIFMFLACFLYVLFGQITVKKLRNNPITKNALGLEYASGWDIINVAQALALPKSWSRAMEQSPLSFLYANSELVFSHTNKFDRILGFIFYWLLTLSGLFGALLVFLNYIGFFAE